ncbi:hypothetical protein OSTOST_20912, partial [Ostertagia ostertagi]
GGRIGDAAVSADYRVAVFGAGGVGKSSIVQRFVKGTFSENYVPTIEDTYRQEFRLQECATLLTNEDDKSFGGIGFPM